MDRHDRPQARGMGLYALGRTAHPLPCRHHRCSVRLLCRNGGTCPEGMARQRFRMVVPSAERAEADVAAVHPRECTFPLAHIQGKGELTDIILSDLTSISSFYGQNRLPQTGRLPDKDAGHAGRPAALQRTLRFCLPDKRAARRRGTAAIAPAHHRCVLRLHGERRHHPALQESAQLPDCGSCAAQRVLLLRCGNRDAALGRVCFSRMEYLCRLPPCDASRDFRLPAGHTQAD